MTLSFFPRPQHPSYTFPGLHLRWSLGWLRANFYYRPLWSFKEKLHLGPKVIWGKRISFHSSARAVGPGTIYLGHDLIFDSRPDLYTHNKSAVLKIGDKTFVNGTRFGVSESITIEKNCILADVRLMDTDFHSVEKNRLSRDAVVKTAPIFIEENVWIAAGSAVLKGVRIGKNSVIAFGSVVVTSVPAGKIYGGHPAKEIGSVES